VLVDAHVAGQFGGTGKTVPWETLRLEYQRDKWPPLILAGGLVPENIREAIRAAEPWGVDVAGGVESSPGVKDVAKVERFLAEARSGVHGD
jgi:phosphoribosylanthranilate isomerase